MLEFAVIVVLCSSWPITGENCVMPIRHVMSFEREEHCLFYVGMLAKLVPITENYPLRVWSCALIGEKS